MVEAEITIDLDLHNSNQYVNKNIEIKFFTSPINKKIVTLIGNVGL